MTIESDKDLSGVTVKVQKGDGLGDDPDGDDNYFIALDRVDVEGGTPYQYFFKGKKGITTTNLQLCMDYGGAPSKANITVSQIKMQISK